MTEVLTYHVVDVFTDRAFAGNPLAVVLDGDGLSTQQMQSIAREFNLSETTFVLPPTTAQATYRLRIFTPMAELPFAGHPSVGTAWLLQSLGVIQTGRVVQECGAGLLPIDVGSDRVELTGGPITQSDPVEPKPLCVAVGLDETDLAGTPPRWCGAGLDWAFLRLLDGAVAKATVDLAQLSAVGPAGVCVFSYDEATAQAHSRVFASDLGVPEDPATGSAALGLGVYLVGSGLLPGDVTSSYQIRQGIEMGRPSTLFGTVRAEGGQAVEVKVAGATVAVATGTITPPPAQT
jgi:trans-2,3-dihydro-3-hydroxyanthranilate isomerase